MTGTRITTQGITKRYGDRNVVDGLDLDIGPGEIVGLLGPNGAGKTTTFNMIVGGLRPTAGRVILGKQDVTDLPMFQRARLGVVYLPQEPSIFRKPLGCGQRQRDLGDGRIGFIPAPGTLGTTAVRARDCR